MTARPYKLLEGDVLKHIPAIKASSVKLIVSSPPYNIRKPYERSGKKTLSQYAEWQGSIADRLVELLVDGGSLCWQTGNYVRDGEIIPLDHLFTHIFRARGLKLRNRIIWRFNFGLHADRRFSGRYETLLWFTKGNNYTFNLDSVRVPQIYPGKRHAARKGQDKAGLPSGNPLGKNPSDCWEFSATRDFIENPVWDIPNVKALHPEKTVHPCQFPIELAERCVLAFTNPSDSVLDPFVGSGASLIAAVKHGRYGIGVDKDAFYIGLARERLSALQQGTLRMRVSGAPIRKPRSTDKVSRIPDEWLAS